METLKVIHENCTGDLIHLFSTKLHDVFKCLKCKKLVKEEKTPDVDESAQLLFHYT